MTGSNLFEYLKANTDTFGNLVPAIEFADIANDLSVDDLTLFYPENDDYDELQYRWNKALTKKFLLNHVAKVDADDPENKFKTLAETLILAQKEDKEGATNTIIISKIGDTVIDPTLTLNQRASNPKYDIYDGIVKKLLPSSQVGLETKNLKDVADERIGEITVDTVDADADTAQFPKIDSDSSSLDFLSMLNAAYSDEQFEEKLGYTFFLPTSGAFTSLYNAVYDGTDYKIGVSEFLSDGGLVETFLAHIVADGGVMQANVYDSMTSKATSKIQVTVENDKSKVKIGTLEAEFTDVNIYTNGQVHEIDTVLFFPRDTTDEELKTKETEELKFHGLITKDNVWYDSFKQKKRSTVFAPTDTAVEHFECFRTWNSVDEDTFQKVLKHHFVDSEERKYWKEINSDTVLKDLNGEEIQTSNIVLETPDVIATNGNIHFVQKFLIPPKLSDSLPSGTITEIAKDKTNELFGYLEDAGLDSDLDKCFTDGAYTLFAPADNAFSSLTAADITYLTKNDNENLMKLLKHHVITSATLVETLNAEQSFKTLNGDTVVVKKSDNDVFVGSTAKVSEDGKEVLAYNGVIHIINEILIPEGMELPSSKPKDNASSMTTVSAISTVLLGAASYVLAAF